MSKLRKAGQRFGDYLNSIEFEHDLDDLGIRLGLSPQDLRHNGERHWGRAFHKLGLIGKHAALDTYVKRTADPRTMAAKFAFKRFAPVINIVISSATIFRIAYHCYQIYLKRSGRTVEL